MKISIDQKQIPIFVIIGGGALLLISFGIRHSFGLYLLPITDSLECRKRNFWICCGLASTDDWYWISFVWRTFR